MSAPSAGRARDTAVLPKEADRVNGIIRYRVPILKITSNLREPATLYLQTAYSVKDASLLLRTQDQFRQISRTSPSDVRKIKVQAVLVAEPRVQFTDRAVEYTSVDDRRKALADIDAAIASASGATPSSFSLATHSRD